MIRELFHRYQDQLERSRDQMEEAVDGDHGAADTLTHAALGAAAGLIGTFVMQGLLAGNKKLLPQALPPIRRDPGEFMVHQAERAIPPRLRQAIPETAETVAARATHLGYGATFGAAYGALRGEGGGSIVTDGTILGLATWAAGYLGWLPATGLTPPPWEQEPQQVAVPAVEHALFGIATVAAYELMHHLVHGQEH